MDRKFTIAISDALDILPLGAPHDTSHRCSKVGHAHDAAVNVAENTHQKALSIWCNTDKVEVAKSLALVLRHQAKLLRGCRKENGRSTSGSGLPSRCGLRHWQGRKLVVVTRPSGNIAL